MEPRLQGRFNFAVMFILFFKMLFPIRAALIIRLLNITFCCVIYTAYIVMCFSYTYNSLIIFSAN